MLIYFILELGNAKFPPDGTTQGTTVPYVTTTTTKTKTSQPFVPPMDEPSYGTTLKPPIAHREIPPIPPFPTEPPQPLLWTEDFRMG